MCFAPWGHRSWNLPTQWYWTLRYWRTEHWASIEGDSCCTLFFKNLHRKNECSAWVKNYNHKLLLPNDYAPSWSNIHCLYEERSGSCRFGKCASWSWVLSSNQSLAVKKIICLTDGSGVDKIMYCAQETRLPSLYAGRSQITCMLLINDIRLGSDDFDHARRNPDK